MLSLPAAIAIAVGTLMIVTIIVTLVTGSLFSAGVVVVLLALCLLVLVQYGFLRVTVRDGDVDIQILESTIPLGTVPTPNAVQRVIPDKEVFHVSDEKFTYEDAPAVCAAYNAELATQEQVDDAFAKGAEWCGYGWSAGGVALFPTQKATWDLLQREVDPQKRMACGRPGVNGGYFDPMMKFGVNCYGKKPAGSIALPLPPPGADTTSFNAQVQGFKSSLQNFFLAPFNRSTWSSTGASSSSGSYGSQFKQDTGKLGAPETDDPYVFQAVKKNPPATV